MKRVISAVVAVCSLTTMVTADKAVLFVKHNEGVVETMMDELDRRSDPEHDLFLQWLSREQVKGILQPHPHHMSAVGDLVARYTTSSHVVVGGDKVVVEFDGPIPPTFLAAAAPHTDCISAPSSSSLNSPFNTSFPPSTRHRRSRVRQPVPKEGGPQSCLSSLDGVTPTCLREAYGIKGSATSGKHGQAVVVNQGYTDSDLAAFQSEYKLPSQGVAHVVGSVPPKAGDEASLDLQYIMTTGSQVDTTYVYLDGSMANPFTNWLVWAAKADDATIPKVHSLSLGAAEDEVGDATIARMNTEMAALGLRGVTILFASGDSGYQPQQKFGAASPYVTAVGGIYNGEMRDGLLQADSLTTGGFAASPLNKAGNWQKKAIAAYKTTIGQRPHPIDWSKRAVPDLAAYDDDINIVLNGADSTLCGTSAATPMVAGMLSLINDALAQAGRNTTLGFANPFLYANEDAFLDIRLGNNRGFAAVKGYDPVSGLGTFSPTTLQSLTAAALNATARRG